MLKVTHFPLITLIQALELLRRSGERSPRWSALIGASESHTGIVQNPRVAKLVASPLRGRVNSASRRPRVTPHPSSEVIGGVRTRQAEPAGQRREEESELAQLHSKIDRLRESVEQLLVNLARAGTADGREGGVAGEGAATPAR